MSALTQQTCEILVQNSGNKGPSPFEVEYLRQLQKELAVFLQGSLCSTLQDVVIGIRGTNYQAVIPLTRSEL